MSLNYISFIILINTLHSTETMKCRSFFMDHHLLLIFACLKIEWFSFSRSSNCCLLHKILLWYNFQIRESLNASYSPCNNLWEFACGGWLSKHSLPPGKSIWNQREELMREGMSSERFHYLARFITLKMSAVKCSYVFFSILLIQRLKGFF